MTENNVFGSIKENLCPNKVLTTTQALSKSNRQQICSQKTKTINFPTSSHRTSISISEKQQQQVQLQLQLQLQFCPIKQTQQHFHQSILPIVDRVFLTDLTIGIQCQGFITLVQKLHKGLINYQKLDSFLKKTFGMDDPQLHCVFRYLVYMQTGLFMEVIDRAQTVTLDVFEHNLIRNHPTATKTQKLATSLTTTTASTHRPSLNHRLPFHKLQTLQHKQIIDQLLKDKEYLLLQLSSRDCKISSLTKTVQLMDLERQDLQQRQEQRIVYERELEKAKHSKEIDVLKSELQQKKEIIKSYQIELEALMQEVNKKSERLLLESFRMSSL